MDETQLQSIFGYHNIERMNEDDVAGELVRPLCHALGYRQGHPEANLRSQVPLQYDRAYLGRKKGERDPVLRGRADFICEVVSYARWVVEAKSPAEVLTLEASQQAHTYATHPEIAAEFYMLCNGREFQLFQVGMPEKPVLQWLKDETDAKLMGLRNLLGPEAMKKRAATPIDLGKPLAPGVASSLRIVGGEVIYSKNTATMPLKFQHGRLAQQSRRQRSASVNRRPHYRRGRRAVGFRRHGPTTYGYGFQAHVVQDRQRIHFDGSGAALAVSEPNQYVHQARNRFVANDLYPWRRIAGGHNGTLLHVSGGLLGGRCLQGYICGRLRLRGRERAAHFTSAQFPDENRRNIPA
jgi:hypothetical protein